MSSNQTPREIDEKLAALHYEATKLEQRVTRAAVRIYQEAGAHQQFRPSQARWSMSLEEALAAVRDHQTQDDRPAWRRRDATEALALHEQAIQELVDKRSEIDVVDALYTGWSRFFVVTSSTGHIHSSMSCSTCYPTTTFGWLPQLSGQDEAEAVKACGPALCSVCFPSAPVEHQRSSLTQAEAEALAAGATIADLRAEKEAAKAAKEAKKAAKEARAVERATKLLAKVEQFYADNGGFETVMAWDSHKIYAEQLNLQTTVGNVVYDDYQEHNDGRGRYYKDPRKVIAAAEASNDD